MESLFAILKAYKAPRLKLLLSQEFLFKVGLNQLSKVEFWALIIFSLAITLVFNRIIQFISMTPNELEVLRESLAQRMKRKGKASFSAPKRVKSLMLSQWMPLLS